LRQKLKYLPFLLFSRTLLRKEFSLDRYCIINVKTLGSSPKELVDEKDSRGQGFKDSSEMLKNYKELKDDIHEVERMLKSLIKSLENKHLNP